jgi:hypothetical protein
MGTAGATLEKLRNGYRPGLSPFGRLKLQPVKWVASPAAVVIEDNPDCLPLNEIDGSSAERRFRTSDPITDHKFPHRTPSFDGINTSVQEMRRKGETMLC